MKKAVMRIVIVLLILVIAVAAWFIGYYNRKSMDNIPSTQIMLDYITEKGEEHATEKIKGYTRESIQYIWGEPDAVLDDGSSDMWTFIKKNDSIEAHILVTYNEKGNVKEVREAYVFNAEVKELYDSGILVESDKDSWVIRSSDAIRVGIDRLEGSQTLQIGDTVEIIFSGGIQESDPAGLDRVHRIRIID